MRSLLALVVATAAVFATSPASASAALACGDVVVADVVLEADLVGCETGLIIGADNVTVDLNGHSIVGQSIMSGAGVAALDRTGVHVLNGRIRGFSTGVQLIGSSQSSVEDLRVLETGTAIFVSSGSEGLGHSNRVMRNRIVDTGAGIVVFAPSTLVAGNLLADVDGIGIWCRASGHIEGNRVVGALTGIELFFCTADVVGNEASGNEGAGIARIRSAGLTARNRASANGSGIVSDDSHGLFLRNVTNANAGNGLSIFDGIETHGPLHTVQDHTAIANGGLGISSNVVGVVSLGTNRARANGDRRECVNVVCN